MDIGVIACGGHGEAVVLAAPPAEREPATEVLQFLAGRYSISPKHLVHPAPSAQQLHAAAAVALRAPDHRQLRPFRFVRIGGEHREALASLFAADAARRGHTAEEVERARTRAWNGPALLAVVAQVRPDAQDVPPHEQWVCVGAGIMNFLNALHVQGFGAKLLSGASVRDPAIQAAFCGSGETLVAWILAGTPTRQGHPKRADVACADLLCDWSGPGSRPFRLT